VTEFRKKCHYIVRYFAVRVANYFLFFLCISQFSNPISGNISPKFWRKFDKNREIFP
jgi:hypothetical protein